MFLTATELQQLTGRIMPTAQARALRAMGIEHRIRPDGQIVVLRAQQLLTHADPGITRRVYRRKAERIVPAK